MDAIKVKLIGLSRGGGGNLQPDKTATPTEQTQIVQPDPGYDGLRQVTVDPIPDEYADVSNVDAGAGDVRVGKIIVGPDGETITGTMPPQKPEEVGHATPTEQAQTVTPTAGSVFSAVEVGAIPSQYADVSSVDATAADVRTGKVIVDAQGDTITGVMEPQKPEQVKSATPTTSPQSVTPDTGYVLSRVDVGAIPSEYADVSDVTATAGTVLTGSDFVDASGSLVHGACDFDADTSDATATAGQIEAGATAYVGGTKVTGTMPVRSADVEISDLSPVPIPAGSYDGTTNAKIDDAEAAKIVPANIKKDVEIFGQVGTYEGADTLGQYFDNTLTSVENDTITSLMASFFAHKSALTRALFPSLAATQNFLFRDCTGLTEVDISGATTIGDGTFYNCNKLTSVNIPLATRLGNDAFHNCKLLETVTGNAVTTVMNNVFVGCEKLSFINVDSWTSLGHSTFIQCYALPETMVFPLVTAMTSGGSGIFYDASVKHLEFPAFLSSINYSTSGTPFGYSNVESIIFAKITNIGQNFFSNATKLTDLVIRTDSVCTLVNINAFNNTPFASGGTGGTLYCSQDLISQYEQATNWSVILAYANNQILPIEGSPYEVTT